MNYLEVLRFAVKGKYLLFVLLFGFLYIVFAAYSLNYRLVIDTILGMFSLGYKFTILTTLLGAIYTAMSRLDFYLILITALLVGINFVLLIRTIQNLRSAGKVGFLVGGSSILGIATVGCTTCGLTLLSVLGLGAAISFVPFGMHLYFLSIGVLLFSIYYMLKKLLPVCQIQAKK